MLAGWPQGSEAIDGRRGRMPAGEADPMHVHQGDEVPRVRSGQILIRCRDQRRTWREGAPVVVAPGVAHGFRAVTETVPRVVAEADTGKLYPGVSDGGEAELAEPYRSDGRPPGQGQEGERACDQATGGERHPKASALGLPHFVLDVERAPLP
jgi:Cupin domain